MESKIMEIHICEHCRKLYQRPHACIAHEKHCKQNPKNKHACFEFCFHLERNEIEDTHFDYHGNELGTYISHIEFYCTKTDTEMYSYIAERKGLKVVKYAKRMPIECDDYECG
jgi:hypothetical protein